MTVGLLRPRRKTFSYLAQPKIHRIWNVDVSNCYHELCACVHRISLDGGLKQKDVYNAEQLDTRGGIFEDAVKAACSAEDSGFWWRVLTRDVAKTH